MKKICVFSLAVICFSLTAQAELPIGKRLSYTKTSGSGTCPQTFSIQYDNVRRLNATTFEPATSNTASESFDLYLNFGGTPSLGENYVSPTSYGGVEVLSPSADNSTFYRAFGGKNKETGEDIWVYRCYYRRIK